MTRWVGYVRVSSDRQRDDGGGADTQAAAIAAWCFERGDELVQTCRDAVPGTLTHLKERAGLQAAFGLLGSGQADGLVVARMDRLARELILQEQIIRELHANGWRVACCDGDIESDTPDRKMVRQILGAVAEYERAMIKMRAAAGRARKKQAGGWLGGYVPYGYRADGKGGLVEDEREMDAIAQALTMRKMGAPYRVIGEWFIAAGIRFRASKRGEWTPQTVRGVLLRATAEGKPTPQPLTSPMARMLMNLPA